MSDDNRPRKVPAYGMRVGDAVELCAQVSVLCWQCGHRGVLDMKRLAWHLDAREHMTILARRCRCLACGARKADFSYLWKCDLEERARGAAGRAFYARSLGPIFAANDDNDAA